MLDHVETYNQVDTSHTARDTQIVKVSHDVAALAQLFSELNTLVLQQGEVAWRARDGHSWCPD